MISTGAKAKAAHRGWARAKMERWADSTDTTIEERFILHMLIRHANWDGGPPVAWPLMETLMMETRIPRRTMIRRIKSLCAKGLISVLPKGDPMKRSRGRSNTYMLHPDGPPCGQDGTSPSGESATARPTPKGVNVPSSGTFECAKLWHTEQSLNSLQPPASGPSGPAKRSGSLDSIDSPRAEEGEYSTDHRSAPRPRPSPFVSTSGGCGPGAQADEAMRDRRVRDRQQAAKKNRDLFMHAIPGDAVDTVFGRVDIGEAEAYNRAVARIGRLSARIRRDHGLA